MGAADHPPAVACGARSTRRSGVRESGAGYRHPGRGPGRGPEPGWLRWVVRGTSPESSAFCRAAGGSHGGGAEDVRRTS
jgi:hypothetical protein